MQKPRAYLPTDTSYTTEVNALPNVPLDKMVKKTNIKVFLLLRAWR
jgi:hypothetical protein